MPCTRNETPFTGNKSSFSPPESTSALSSAPEQVDNYLWPNLEKQHRDKFYPGKKIYIFFTHRLKKKIIFLNFIFIGKMMKRLWRKAYSFAK